MKRIVYDSGYVSPPGVFECLEIYPSQHALDVAEILETLPNTYVGMWENALSEPITEEEDENEKF